MAETITLPKLGFDMREGTFLNWVKKVGDTVKKGDVIAEIESDKATIEIESTADGVILQTLVNAGDVVPVDAPIAVIGGPGEKPAEGAGPAKTEAAKPEPQKAEQPAGQPAGQSTGQQGQPKSGTLARGQ